jgi:hypothetical protein
MAKQTFTTGQVLTAAQMTSLQQTAMGGGSPSTKTASYVLTAADAGTVIQMNSASATTITVNTSLFSAGDSVQIQNIGAGICTITAGTATVNSAGSLGVTQYDGGFLYFSSASSAIWFDYTQASSALPLTTKGDLFGYSTTNARVPIGTNGQVLTADSAEALGLKWATASAAASTFTLINTGGTAASGTSTTISSLGGYNQYIIVTSALGTGSAGSKLNFRVNGDSTSKYNYYGYGQDNTVNLTYVQSVENNGAWEGASRATSGTWYWYGVITGANGAGYKNISYTCFGQGASSTANVMADGWYTGTSAITSMTFYLSSGSFSQGTIYIYGAN